MTSGQRTIAAIAIAFALLPAVAQAQTEPALKAATIQLFSPEGSVKDARQAQARFSAPMVAFGDPTLADPFTVDCAAPGKGRWADARNWIYDFDADLPGGLRCRFTLRTDAKTLDGRPLAGKREFRFDTGGPSIRASFPREGWEEVDEQQVFLLKLDAVADPASIGRQAHCVVDGIQEQIPVDVLTGGERERMLAERRSLGYSYYQLLWKSGRSSDARVRDRTLESVEAEIAVVRCRRNLPPATQLRLVWGAGIATADGIATTAEQALAFRVRPAFTVRVECARANADAGCLPMQPIRVAFGTPVPRALAMAVRLRFADGKELAPTPLAGAPPPFLESVSFAGPHPAARTATVHLPAALADDAGRTPVNADRYPVEITIDEYPPLAKFAGDFGILESAEGGVLPVTIRNIESEVPAASKPVSGSQLRLGSDPATIAAWLRRVQAANKGRGEWLRDPKTREQYWREDTGDRSVFAESDAATLSRFTIAKSEGAKPAEVIGIPLGGPGLYVVEIASARLGASTFGPERAATRYVSTAALVTNLAVHFKWGREASRVWVTRLDDGSVVPDARVVIADYCSGAVRWEGRTDADGIAAIRASFGEAHSYGGCEWVRKPLIAVATLADDTGFAVSSWTDGIEPYNFGLPVGSENEAAAFHTVLDRPLFRAGETVSMKHFLRRRQLDGIGLPDGAAGTRTVVIQHQGSDQSYRFEIAFRADGTAEQQWPIPADARLGDYEISIKRDERRYLVSGQFKVQQYRLPVMRATVQGPPHPIAQPKQVTLDLHVAYLSGGGAGGLPVRLRTTVESAPLQVAGYEDYTFGGAAVTEGIVRQEGYVYDFDPEAGEEPANVKTRLIPLTLDADGSARVTIDELPETVDASRLVAELEYPDPNGELLTATGRVRLVPSAVQLGIRREGWVASDQQMRFRVVALDLDGKPLARQKIAVALYLSKAYSYRKRLIGGFYTYETIRETARIPEQCEGTTDQQGLLLCELAPGVSGEVKVRAETRDGAGLSAGATASIWVIGEDDWWFGGTQGDRMDVLPEKKEYEAGDVARLQVRMPFRTATALVTVEREGVIESFVTRLSGKKPIVKLPVGTTFAPNVYVSVLAVRGRVGAKARGRGATDETVTALVDLNKPSYRLGTAGIRVGWKPHRLDVTVEPAASVFRVRDTAEVRVRVRRTDGSALPAGAEVALAAIDEALLELAPNPSWALLDAMMGERGQSVWTSTAQMQVVGKRHYGRKAVAQGGGGGRDRARELFDSLLLWQPRLALDANGEATLRIPLNDSLTSFRIVAIAHAGTGLFGTGSASVTTTQDLMLLPGLPPLVREGDRFAATFTVRNTTKAAMTVEVTPAVEPALASTPAAQRLVIAPGGAADVSWDVTVPVGAKSLAWEVTAKDAAASASDRLRATQSVVPVYPVRTYQATLLQLTEPFSLTVERPARAVPGRGGIDVNLRAKLGDGLDGVREYMTFYAYNCIEQKLSQAVALRSRELWDAAVAQLPAYQDDDGLVKFFISNFLEGDDALTAYVLAIADEAGYAIPAAARDRMIDGLTGFVQGRVTRYSALPTADLAIRKLAAIEALSRHGAAEAAMLDSITIEPQLWPTSAVLDWHAVLGRIEGLRQRDERRKIAETVLRSRLNFQGTSFGFSTEQSDALWWLMISTDTNAAKFLLSMIDRADWREDVPRLVRGLLGRQQRGHWNTTLANAWSVLAMEKFSAAFERTPVAGRTALAYGARTQALDWTAAKGELSASLPWQEGKKDVTARHEGTGRPWLTIRSMAAMPLTEPISTGYRIRRSVTPVVQSVPGQWTRGDVLRVKLEIDAQSDMTWVVVDDPVPAGSTVLGSGLGGQSELMQRGEQSEGWVWPAFTERRFDAYRGYYRFVPKGPFSLEYTLRLNNPGEFLLPATRVEAMYAPEMLGEIPNDALTVLPSR